MKIKLMKKAWLSGAGALIESNPVCLVRSWRGSWALAASHWFHVPEENFLGTILIFFAKIRISYMKIPFLLPLVIFELHSSHSTSCPSWETWSKDSLPAGLEALANTTFYAHAKGYALLICCFSFFIIVCGTYSQASKAAAADSRAAE